MQHGGIYDTKMQRSPPPLTPRTVIILLPCCWAGRSRAFDSFLATQRILADFATRKSASAIKTVREGMSDSENSPAAILTELAVEGTANLTEAQRVLLNLVEQENEIVMDGVNGTRRGLSERPPPSRTAAPRDRHP